jgi:hypothetical protein
MRLDMGLFDFNSYCETYDEVVHRGMDIELSYFNKCKNKKQLSKFQPFFLLQFLNHDLSQKTP